MQEFPKLFSGGLGFYKGCKFTIEDDESNHYTVINTHRGLFQYNRLSFGISAVSGIFQRPMEGMSRDISRVFLNLDDIFIAGTTEVEHMKRLRLVLSALQTA